MGRSTWVKLNRILNERRLPNKIPILKDCLNKPVQKQEITDVCHYKISQKFRLFNSQHSPVQREFLERAILALTLTTVQKLDMEEKSNHNLPSPPILSPTPAIYFNVNNIKISVTRKGNSSWQRRVYIKHLVGFHLEYCILHICWLFILHHTHTHTPMYARQASFTRVKWSSL